MTSYIVCFWLFPDHVCSQSIYASENPVPVGSNVTLFSGASVSTGSWKFGTDTIIFIFEGKVFIPNTWENRVIFNSTTSSLTLKSVQMEDSGLFTLQALNYFTAQLTLSVQGKDHFITSLLTTNIQKYWIKSYFSLSHQFCLKFS